jgi:two-component system sensor histidine kinase TctE
VTGERRGSLRQRLLKRLWVPLLTLMTVGAALSLVSARYFADLVYDQWLYDSAMTLGSQIKGNGSEPVLRLPALAVEMLEWDRVDRLYYEVVTAKHGRIYGNASLPHSSLPPSPNAPADDVVYYNDVLNGIPVRLARVDVPIPESGGDAALITVAETISKREAVVRSILLAVLPIEITLLILAGASIWIAVTATLRSLDQLAGDLTKVEPEALRPLPESAHLPQEVMPLVDALNSLIGRLAETRDTMRRFVANAAHQFRTPLAAVQIQVQRARREDNAGLRDEALAAADTALQRVTHLAEQILGLARAEPASIANIDMTQVDIAALARAAVEHWADAAIDRGVDLGYEGPFAPVTVRGDRRMLTDLIDNLIDNAIRYGKPAGRVTVSLATGPLVIAVEDDGPGIPPAERTRVLERFYRTPGTGSRGSGLGLAIANEIAARHGGRLEIMSGKNNVGARVALRLS